MDLDGSQVKNNENNHYGYKIKFFIAAVHRFIKRFVITPASI
jgi:hypothetical protein